MRNFNYRLCLPSADLRGAQFNKLSEKVQDEIEKTLNGGYLIPTTISLDVTPDTVRLQISNASELVEFDAETTKAFHEWLNKLIITRFTDERPQLWRDQKDEE